MNDGGKCPACGSRLSGKLCRRCSFAAALEDDSAGGELQAAGGGKTPFLAGYEFLEELGRGGAAVVWLAREEKLNRLVAIKLIQHPAGPRIQQRLLREGQTVARLRHPHIVPVYAMGSTAAQSYLVMHFVEGGDLRAGLAGGPRTPREAAGLTRQLADGLAYAHSAGVLHRDIKPSNVLLDSVGQPLLADFGLAVSLGESGDLTSPGQVAGTAAYLAPELLGGADRASQQSDVYGLGALLYSCLTGRAPFIGDGTAAILAQVASAEPPAPRLLQPGIPRDLETLCLKCLQKNPAHRYPSARDVRDDLDRYLRGEPIAARPVNRFIKAARWCALHRAIAALGGAAAGLLLVLAIGGPIAALRLSHARAQARDQAEASQSIIDFIKRDLLAQAAPEYQPERDVTLREVVDRAAADVTERFEQQPLTEAAVRRIFADTYRSLGRHEAERSHLERALELYQRHAGHESPDTLATRGRLAAALLRLGLFSEGEAVARATGAAQRRVLGADHAETLRTLYDVAEACELQGRMAEAVAMHVDVLERRKAVLGSDHPAVLQSVSGLAVAYRRSGNLAAAETLNRHLLETRTRLFGREHPDTLTAVNALAIVFQFQDKFAEAEALQRPLIEMQRRILGPDHPTTLSLVGALAASLQFQGKLAEAEEFHRQACEGKQRALGDEHPGTLGSLNALSLNLVFQGRFREAETLAARVLGINSAKMGPDSPGLIPSINNLAVACTRQGRFAEAESLHRRTLEIARRAFGPEHPIALEAMDYLGALLLQQDRVGDAVAMLREAVARRESSKPDDWRTDGSRGSFGEALYRSGNHAEAKRLIFASSRALQEKARIIPKAYRDEELARVDRRLGALAH